jgi:glyoxylase-like metal-dependent hydrolase (beta-lactamase superfamily II)
MALRFDRSFDPRHGEPVAVAPLVRRITAPNPGPFTFTGTNTFLVGAERLVVIDPGPDDEGHISAILAAIGPAKVDAILITHSHADHVPGARPLQAATGAPILAAVLQQVPASSAGSDLRLDAAVDDRFAPDVRLADGEIIEGDGFSLEAIATPGHASDHLAFAMRGTDILFSGDHVMGWSTTVVAPPDGSMQDYMASLERLLARPERSYLPAHGGAVGKAHAYVRGLRTHRRMRERAIRERLELGDTTIQQMVSEIYRDVDPRLHRAAALSTLAHLQDLVARGLAASSGETGLDARYWPLGSARGKGTAGTASLG